MTVVAGEPAVVHVRVENELKDANVNDTIVGRAGGRHTVEIIIKRACLLASNPAELKLRRHIPVLKYSLHKY